MVQGNHDCFVFRAATENELNEWVECISEYILFYIIKKEYWQPFKCSKMIFLFIFLRKKHFPKSVQSIGSQKNWKSFTFGQWTVTWPFRRCFSNFLWKIAYLFEVLWGKKKKRKTHNENNGSKTHSLYIYIYNRLFFIAKIVFFEQW